MTMIILTVFLTYLIKIQLLLFIILASFRYSLNIFIRSVCCFVAVIFCNRDHKIG